MMQISEGFKFRRALIIAKMFLRESRRQGGLVICFFVYAALIFSLPLFARFALGQEVNLVLEMIGDSATLFSVILCALLIGSINERERTSKTDTLLLSKPVRLSELLVGRFVGVILLVAIATVLSFVLSIYPLWSAEPTLHGAEVPFGRFIEKDGVELVKVILLSMCRSSIVAGFLVILGPYFQPFGTFVAAVIVYFISTINHYLFAGLIVSGGAARIVGIVLRTVFPNNSIADVGEYLGRGEEIPWAIPILDFSYCVLYLGVLLLVGRALWARREV